MVVVQLVQTVIEEPSVGSSSASPQLFSMEPGTPFPKARADIALSLQALCPQVQELHAIWLTLGLAEKCASTFDICQLWKMVMHRIETFSNSGRRKPLQAFEQLIYSMLVLDS